MTTTTVLWLIASLSMLQPLSTDMYLPTLPGIATGFGATAASVQWTLSIFVIGFGTWQLVVGPMSDRFGRRPVIVAGAVTYLAASVLCAAAPTLAVLVLGRLAQAIGACSCLVGARGLVRDLYVPSEGARLLARGATILAFAPLLAPVFGAWLYERNGWRSTFVVLAIFGAALLLFALTRLAETNRAPARHALAPGPMLANYLRVARSPVFRAYTLATSASWSTMFAFISGSPFVMTRVLGLTPQQFGFAFSVVVAGYLVGTLAGRRLVGRHGIQRTVLTGAALHFAAGVSLVGFALAGVIHPVAIIGPMWFHACAHGVVQPTGQAGAVAPFADTAGAASALMGFVMMLIAAAIGYWIGVSYDGTVYPLTLTIGAIALASAAIAVFLVRPHGDVSHHG
jgi:DHA1 family bicyclomycin/chloramphenicol resistance-like MFS transporter